MSKHLLFPRKDRHQFTGLSVSQADLRLVASLNKTIDALGRLRASLARELRKHPPPAAAARLNGHLSSSIDSLLQMRAELISTLRSRMSSGALIEPGPLDVGILQRAPSEARAPVIAMPA